MTRRWKLITASALAGLLIAGVAAVAPSSGNAVLLPQPITLTFAGEITGGAGLGPFTDAYPPIEGGVDRVYTVPARQRLVIESMYIEVNESVPLPYSGRSGIQAGISTWYNLGPTCAFPGWERGYSVTLTNPVSQQEVSTIEKRFQGSIPGPIFVEGGRSIDGVANAPGGDDRVIVKVVAHGYLEPSFTNPAPPTCG